VDGDKKPLTSNENKTGAARSKNNGRPATLAPVWAESECSKVLKRIAGKQSGDPTA